MPDVCRLSIFQSPTGVADPRRDENVSRSPTVWLCTSKECSAGLLTGCSAGFHARTCSGEITKSYSLHTSSLAV
jgi:hypothetical protein